MPSFCLRFKEIGVIYLICEIWRGIQLNSCDQCIGKVGHIILRGFPKLFHVCSKLMVNYSVQSMYIWFVKYFMCVPFFSSKITLCWSLGITADYIIWNWTLNLIADVPVPSGTRSSAVTIMFHISDLVQDYSNSNWQWKLPRLVPGHQYDQYIDGLVQDCSNSSALAMELLQSCTKPLM